MKTYLSIYSFFVIALNFLKKDKPIRFTKQTRMVY